MGREGYGSGEEGEQDNLKGLQGSCGFLRLNKSVVVVLQCSWSVGSRSPENTKICEFLNYLYEMAQDMYTVGPPYPQVLHPWMQTNISTHGWLNPQMMSLWKWRFHYIFIRIQELCKGNQALRKRKPV